MTRLRVTLDTNVVLDLWRKEERWRADVERLLELARDGQIELAITKSVPAEVLGDHRQRLDDIGDAVVLDPGGLFILGVSTLGGDDRLGAQAVLDLEIELRNLAAVGGPTPPEPADWLLMHEHLVNGRHWFVTRDGKILQFAEQLAGVGILVLSPHDFLNALFPTT